jgi:type I restriction enzyme S subunit
VDEQHRIVVCVEALFDRIEEARRLRGVAGDDVDRLMEAVTFEIFPNPEGTLPEGWQVSKIAEISQKPQYGYTESAHEEPVGPRFLRITDIQEGEVDWETVPFCPCTEQELENYKLKPGDIVFARSGATTGKTFLVGDCPEAVFASYLIRLQIRDGVLPEYVYAFFQSPYYWQQIQPRGAAQPNVNATVLSDLKVPTPLAIEDQRRIVRFLKKVWAQENALRRARETAGGELDRLEQSILARAFRGEL